ncbi:hypothetical protein [Tenggerimyces flavus]|uniref:Uncharacterized protein n=1 Tax=Tenggerimyces flavus TaxID=1708749 RepID=A0ABV7YAJ6_9ACTN|nr:hypothetical protein [Tenggerimyces flavus]MBM7785448.1 hypothetical protein [Tenggerimyces flavus]
MPDSVQHASECFRRDVLGLSAVIELPGSTQRSRMMAFPQLSVGVFVTGAQKVEQLTIGSIARHPLPPDTQLGRPTAFPLSDVTLDASDHRRQRFPDTERIQLRGVMVAAGPWDVANHGREAWIAIRASR